MRIESQPMAYTAGKSNELKQPVQTTITNPQDSVLFSGKTKPLTYRRVKTIHDPNIGDLQIYKFSNGLKLYGIKREGLPLVSYGILVKTGAREETKKTSGLAHFLEHMIFKGTKQIPPGEGMKMMEALGAKINADTSFDRTFYFVYNTPNKALKKIIEIYGEMVQKPYFPPKEIEFEKGAVLNEEDRIRDEPAGNVSEELTQQIFAGHPYQRGIIGLRESVQGATRKQLLDYHKKGYAPNNSAIVVVGNFDMNEVLETVASTHNKLKPAKKPAVKGKLSDKWSQQEIKITHPKLQHAIFSEGALGPKPRTKTFSREYTALQLLAAVLGSGRSSRLHQLLVETQLASKVSVSTYNARERSLIGWDVDTQPEHLDKVREIVREEINRVAREGIPADELRKAKIMTEASIAKITESGYAVERALAESIVTGDTEQSFGPDSMKDLHQVQSADIQDVVKKYLQTPNIKTAISVPGEKREVINKKSQPKFSGKLNADEKSFTLKSGTEVIVKEMLTRNTNISVSIKTGTHPGTLLHGEASLLGALLQRGTEKLKSSELFEKMEKNGIQLSVEPEPDRITVSISGMKYFKEEMLDLLGQVLTEPGLREEDLAFLKHISKEQYKVMVGSDDAALLGQMTNKEIFPEGHLYGTTFERIFSRESELTAQHLRDVYGKYLRQQNMTVAITGNLENISYDQALQGNTASVSKFTPQQMADKVEALLSKLPADALTRPAVAPVSIPKNRLITKSKEGLQQSTVMKTWIAPGYNSPEDRYAMTLLNAMIGGGFGSILFQAFRGPGKEALSYGAYANYSPRMEAATYSMSNSSDHKYLPDTLRIFQEEIDKLVANPPSQEVLDRAKIMVLPNFDTQQESSNTVSKTVANHRNMNLPSSDELKDILGKITPEDIHRVAKKYFGQPAITYVMAPKDVLAQNNLPVDGER